MIKRQSQLLFQHATELAQVSNGINGRGPPEAGRMPFMPAVSLNQWSGALPAQSWFGKVFPDAFFFLFSPSSAVQSFGFPQRLLSERELLWVLGFKLLSVGAGLQTW
jgi:hypothetical protein